MFFKVIFIAVFWLIEMMEIIILILFNFHCETVRRYLKNPKVMHAKETLANDLNIWVKPHF